MNEAILDKAKLRNGIYYLSDGDDIFELKYIELRKKENRIYSDEEVKLLPYASANNPHKNEWKLRKRSLDRFNNYIYKFDSKLNLLDVGCGNGWFSSNIAKNKMMGVYALDINKTELEQAARVFNYQNINFIYGNIFENIFEQGTFDIVTLNSSAQYFDDLRTLIKRLFYFLSEEGEIHIIDSPFYNQNEVAGAKERTARYYISTGFREMVKHYHHHTFDELNDFDHTILYNPKSSVVKLKNIFGIKDSPFPWIRIKK